MIGFLNTLCMENFDEIAVSHTVKEIEGNLCFAIFWQKFENSKWPPFLGRGNCFENCQEYVDQAPCGSKISTKSLYLARLKGDRSKFVFFHILAKTRKFKMAAIFGEGEFF